MANSSVEFYDDEGSAEERIRGTLEQQFNTIAACPVDWVGLQRHLRGKTHTTLITELDLSGFKEITDKQWHWLCGDILPNLTSIEKLFLSRMSLTDQSVNTLWSCLVGRRSSARTVQAGGNTTPQQKNGEQVAFCLPAIRVVDVSHNRLTSRSALPLGKLILKAAASLDEVNVSGNNFQDYGFQVLGIYLSKLHPERVLQEPALFSSDTLDALGSLSKPSRSPAHRSSRSGSGPGALSTSVEHLGPFIVDARGCNASVRGLSELLAAASRTNNTRAILLSYNCSASTNGASVLKQPVFSNFEQLEENTSLQHASFVGVPLSRVCSPAGCRQLFYNFFFRCRQLETFNCNISFSTASLSDECIDAVIEKNRRQQELQLEVRGTTAVEGWYLFLEEVGETLFSIENVIIGGQVSVGDVWCELVAQTAFNARAEGRLCPPAYVFLRELHLSSSGLTDMGVRGLCIALRTVDVTAVCQNLSVLDLSNNLLTMMGCVNVIHSFITQSRYELTSVVSLQLQGNAGVLAGDRKALEMISKNSELALQRRLTEATAAESIGAELNPLRIEFGPFGDDAAVFSSSFDPRSDDIICTFPGAQERVVMMLNSYNAGNSRAAATATTSAMGPSVDSDLERRKRDGNGGGVVVDADDKESSTHGDSDRPASLPLTGGVDAEVARQTIVRCQAFADSMWTLAVQSLEGEESSVRRAIAAEEGFECTLMLEIHAHTTREARRASLAQIVLEEQEGRRAILLHEGTQFVQAFWSIFSVLLSQSSSSSVGAPQGASLDDMCEAFASLEQAKEALESEVALLVQQLNEATADLNDQETLLLRESERAIQMLQLSESESVNRLNSLLDRCVTIVERGNSRASSFAFASPHDTTQE